MSKGQKKSSSSSPSVPVAVVTTAPIVHPPPPPPLCLLVPMTILGAMCTRFSLNFMSQLGQLGTNPFSFAAPLAVPEPAPLMLGA